ncbi:Protein hypA [Clostridiaceae bacterium JG1575]|nr:Protein hypA [Clostridiaceae bacterium JG1575]
MDQHQSLNGFHLEKEIASPETGATAYYYTYEKTGTPLLFLKNSDPNRAFGIGFKTPPKDSTGVAHILEHSVLSGSRKFKTREPFMELLKSSMNTFLNAMTYSDMTLYPLSSMNAKDFKNLVDVYMDSVLFPILYERKEIFLQEGWHHEIFSKEEPIRYNGVVYNEMRGAYSSPESNVATQVSQALNEGTTYGLESGGYPYDIPNLSYENLLAFHRRYYHPSNALIYLYGDVDFADISQLLDEEYLSHFERKECPDDLVLKEQTPGIKRKTFQYPSDASQTAQANAYLSYAVCLGKAANVQDYFMNFILNEILVQSESSPLKEALKNADLGEDTMSLSGDSYYLDFGLAVKNTDAARLDEFTKVVEDTLKELVEKGIDPKLLAASINHAEFRLREAQGSLRGIIYFVNAMSAWRYGCDPLQNMQFQTIFPALREGMEKGLFEQWIRERILENPVKVFAVHCPDKDFFQAKDQAMEEALAEYKKALSDAALQELIAENETLRAFQMTDDSKEDKATIPHLSKADISRTIRPLNEEEVPEEKGLILYHPFESADILYFTASFSLDRITREELPFVGYLAALLGITDTKELSYQDLNNEIHMNTSGLSFHPAVYKSTKDPMAYEARFQVSGAALSEKMEYLPKYMEQVIYTTDFSSTKRIREALLMLRSNMEMGFDYSGHDLAMRRVSSFFSPGSRYQEELLGVAFYDHLNRMLKNLERPDFSIEEDLVRVAKKIFAQGDVVVSLTSDEEHRSKALRLAQGFLAILPSIGELEASVIPFDFTPKQEGITSASGVQYVAKGYNLKQMGYTYSGELTVLSSILSKDYLHNAIRARGGAYGAGILMDPSGNVSCFSYRDPNLANTVKTFDGCGAFLRQMPLDEEDVTQYIIGSMTKFNPPMAAMDINALALGRRFSATSEADIEQRMNEAIEATRDSLMSHADLLDELMEKNYLVCYGNEDTIRASEGLFSEIRPIRNA